MASVLKLYFDSSGFGTGDHISWYFIADRVNTFLRTEMRYQLLLTRFLNFFIFLCSEHEFIYLLIWSSTLVYVDFMLLLNMDVNHLDDLYFFLWHLFINLRPKPLCNRRLDYQLLELVKVLHSLLLSRPILSKLYQLLLLAFMKQMCILLLTPLLAVFQILWLCIDKVRVDLIRLCLSLISLIYMHVLIKIRLSFVLYIVGVITIWEI